MRDNRCGCRAGLDRPGAAIEQALGLVVAQAHELLARGRHRIAKAEEFADAAVVETARLVQAHEHLPRTHDGGGVDLAAADDAALAEDSGLQAPPSRTCMER
jgi:hypothetical protein